MKKAAVILLTTVMTAAFLTACGENSASGEVGQVTTQEEAVADSVAVEQPASSEEETVEPEDTAGETVSESGEETSQETSGADMSDPFVEFVYAPYQSEYTFGDIDSAEAADAYRQSQGMEKEDVKTLENGIEICFSDSEYWDLDTGELYDGIYLEFKGTVGESEMYTYYSYSESALDSVVTDFGTVQDASGGLAPVGGFADYAEKYNCFTIADFFRSFGMEEEGLMKALEEYAIIYETSFETAFGTVEVSLEYFSVGETNSREAAIIFPDESSSPWKKIFLLEYDDSMAVHGWTAAYRWLYG